MCYNYGVNMNFNSNNCQNNNFGNNYPQNMDNNMIRMMNMMNPNFGYQNQFQNDVIEFIFVKKNLPETKITAYENELFSNVIRYYQMAAKDMEDNDYYYNNQIINPSTPVKNFNTNNNRVYIKVISKNTEIVSTNTEFKYSLLNKVPMDFEENGVTIKVLVDNSASFKNAMNEYETKTNSKGQNEYFVNERQIDPYKNSIENGISNTSKIVVQKNDYTMNKLMNMNNGNGLSLWFQKENTQNILILAKYSELLQIVVEKYLAKLNNLGNQEINNKYDFLFNEKRLMLNQTVFQNELKNGSVITVKNQYIFNVFFCLDNIKTSVQATQYETIGELIKEYKLKRNLNLNDNYTFLYNAKILNDFYKTLIELNIYRNSIIDVIPPGIIGAKKRSNNFY